jgi:hypothetical protein
MSKESSAADNADTDDVSRTIETPEFLKRLAEDLKEKSGSDLPLSCFIEQVKMQLAGKSRAEVLRIAANQSKKPMPMPTYETSDCFRAWAMPE